MKLPESYSTEWDRDSFGRLAYKYLKNRNLSDQAIHEYELGFCSEGDYKGYVIVPFYENGEIVFFQARKFLSLANKPDHKNPPRDSANGKSQVIFNLDRISKNRSVVITEGVFDAMAVKKNAIAILGKKMSKYQIDKLVSRGVNDIVILLDEDAFEETQQLAANLHDVFDRVAIARLKEYKDPGSAPRSEILGSLAKAHVYDPGGFSLISHKILTL
jgi:DNA primase